MFYIVAVQSAAPIFGMKDRNLEYKKAGQTVLKTICPAAILLVSDFLEIYSA